MNNNDELIDEVTSRGGSNSFIEEENELLLSQGENQEELNVSLDISCKNSLHSHHSHTSHVNCYHSESHHLEPKYYLKKSLVFENFSSKETKWLNSIHKTLLQKDARNLAIFLVINILYMFVEIIIGYMSNSIGLISDAGHMFVDCFALFISFSAMVINVHGQSVGSSSEFERVEVLAGFTNGLFLVFVSIAIFHEAFHRMTEPPKLSKYGLLLTSVGGLLVNIIGVKFFHHYAHLGSDCEDGSHGHSHTSHVNLNGVFLHILADLLGSVGVVISSCLIQWKGWMIADPVCSFFIGVLILLSVQPLLKETALILLLQPSIHASNKCLRLLQEVSSFKEVSSITSHQLMRLTEKKYMLSIEVKIDPEFPETNLKNKLKTVISNYFPSETQICLTMEK